MKNLLFIPSYNCERQIGKTLINALEFFYLFNEIVIVDNRSTDLTSKVINDFILKNQLSTNVKYVLNPKNIGLGGSHKLIFQYAIEKEFDHVVILHGDNQGNLADFRGVLIEALETYSDSYVMGSRFSKDSTLINYPKFRIFGNVVFNILASAVTMKPILDFSGSGLNLFPVKLLREHPFEQYPNNLTFHAYLVLNSIKLKSHIKFKSISWSEEDQVSNVKLFKQSYQYLRLLLKSLLLQDIICENKDFSFHHSSWDDK